MTLTASLLPAISELSAVEWNALIESDQPFVQHAFLLALESSGSIRRELGWQPQHLLLHEGSKLVGAAPCYLKYNSHGEFVFDWAWAEAYQRHGLDYYPKLLVGVPYTPITGPRLLVGNTAQSPRYRQALRNTLQQLAESGGLSSVHLNFLNAADAASLSHDPWMPRSDWQFHWQNAEYRDFADFLDTLQSKKRKNIRQERRHLHEAGIEFRCQDGSDISAADWKQLHQLYVSTFAAKHNTPALTASFFRQLGRSMPAQILAITAWHNNSLLAMALCFKDRERLYGRYWGCHQEIPGLHFETCYYQGIEYAIAHKLKYFEPGAQGEHKIARGFLPQRTRSAHHVVHSGFRVAIRKAIAAELRSRTEIAAFHAEHSPYRRDAV